jgi:hypothetical protein
VGGGGGGGGSGFGAGAGPTAGGEVGALVPVVAVEAVPVERGGGGFEPDPVCDGGDAFVLVVVFPTGGGAGPGADTPRWVNPGESHAPSASRVAKHQADTRIDYSG